MRNPKLARLASLNPRALPIPEWRFGQTKFHQELIDGRPYIVERRAGQSYGRPAFIVALKRGLFFCI